MGLGVKYITSEKRKPKRQKKSDIEIRRIWLIGIDDER